MAIPPACWLDQHAVQASQYSHIMANPSHVDRQPYQHTELIMVAAATEDVHRRWPIVLNGLIKPVDTPRSAGNSFAIKQANAQAHADAIQATVPLARANILLVDDLFTTGCQFDAVGRKLAALGAARVDGLVLARVPWGA